MAELDFNVNDVFNDVLWQIRPWIQELWKESKKLIDARTPEDTKNMLNKNEYSFTENNQIMRTRVSNNSDYVLYVEYWVQNKIYRYNKPKWHIFKRAVWAAMFRLTLVDIEQRIKEFIK